MKALQDTDIDPDILLKRGGGYKIQCFVSFQFVKSGQV